MLKIKGANLRIVHFDYTNIPVDEATGQEIYFDIIPGFDSDTQTLGAFRLKWVYRLYKDGKVFLSYIAEDDYKIDEMKSMRLIDFKKILSSSYMRMMKEYQVRIKEHGNHRIFLNQDSEEIAEAYYKMMALLISSERK